MTEPPPQNELSSTGYWDTVWAGRVRMRLPSRWVVAIRNLQDLLRGYVRPGDRFLEIGCAPGKILAWVEAELGADVAGLDYSEAGMATARRLFAALRLSGDLRCEDLGRTTFAAESFDVVYSSGLIEHFADPRGVVGQHLALLKPGGTAVITVPNFRGVYGRLQRYFDAELLAIHNLDIMTCDALLALVADVPEVTARAFPAGRLSPWIVSVERRWPAPIALAVCHLFNLVALLQPVQIASLCPMLVLEVRKRPT